MPIRDQLLRLGMNGINLPGTTLRECPQEKCALPGDETTVL